MPEIIQKYFHIGLKSLKVSYTPVKWFSYQYYCAFLFLWSCSWNFAFKIKFKVLVEQRVLQACTLLGGGFKLSLLFFSSHFFLKTSPRSAEEYTQSEFGPCFLGLLICKEGQVQNEILDICTMWTQYKYEVSYNHLLLLPVLKCQAATANHNSFILSPHLYIPFTHV